MMLETTLNGYMTWVTSICQSTHRQLSDTQSHQPASVKAHTDGCQIHSHINQHLSKHTQTAVRYTVTSISICFLSTVP